MNKMQMIMNIEITEAGWSKHHEAMSAIRREVFIVEQHVPEDLEWDGLDVDCVHVLAQDITQKRPVGTGRLVADGQIGRMAIHKDYRRMGIGHKILQHLLELAKRDGHTEVYLHAQLYIVDFYQQAQFEKTGDTFIDAGIPHIKMTRKL